MSSPDCWCDVNTEPTCNVSCSQLKEHGEVAAERDRLRVALNEIATAPLVDINADGADQASEAMQVIARVALGGVYA